MRRRSIALLLALCTLAPPAFAEILISGQSFSGSTFDAIGMTPFDPSLGTLDSVNVSIDGTLTVSGVTPTAFVFTGQSLVAVPYQFQVQVNQDFSGLLGKYFDFSTPALFVLPGSASGNGEGFSYSTQFQYSFSFDAASDLVGFAIPSFSTSFGTLTPPVDVAGTRSDFYRDMIPIDEVDLTQNWSVLSFGPAFGSVSVASAGAMIVQYNYTPAPTSIPEPASLALLGVGLAGVGFARRKASR